MAIHYADREVQAKHFASELRKKGFKVTIKKTSNTYLGRTTDFWTIYSYKK